MKNKKIIIGSRGSKLALIYAEKAREKILTYAKDFGIEEVTIKNIVTKGDQVQDKRLSEVGGKGLFSKTIEVELLNNKIDIAVHALKDMPSEETKGLLTNCFLKRNDPREILISRNNKCLKDLAPNAIVGMPCSFSVMIEAPVSSQLDSIPSIMGFLFIKLVFINNTISI